MRYNPSMLLMATVLLGCGAGTSPLSRLEKESPVVGGKLIFSTCSLNEVPTVESQSPVHVKRSKPIELRGTLKSGDWATTVISTYWKYRDGESFTIISRGSSVLPTVLLFNLYGNNAKKDNGLITTEMVESRFEVETSEELLFRATLIAPSKAGKYVIDLHAIDPNVPARKRGEELKKMPGFPIWRREIVVD